MLNTIPIKVLLGFVAGALIVTPPSAGIAYWLGTRAGAQQKETEIRIASAEVTTDFFRQTNEQTFITHQETRDAIIKRIEGQRAAETAREQSRRLIEAARREDVLRAAGPNSPYVRSRITERVRQHYDVADRFIESGTPERFSRGESQPEGRGI